LPVSRRTQIQCKLLHCTVHKHRNLLAHAPRRLHEEVSGDYNDMIYATSAAEIEVRRRAFIRKWRLKREAVADSLEEADDRLFTFTRCPSAKRRVRAQPMPSNGCTRSSNAG
jgi:transposase-like protein